MLLQQLSELQQKARIEERRRDEVSSISSWRVTYVQSLTVRHSIRKIDDARMTNDRMTVAALAKELRGLSRRVEEGFAQVNERFAGVDQRFETLEARFDGLESRFDRLESNFDDLRNGIDAKLEDFATRIELRFQVLMEDVRKDFKGISDLAMATAERLYRHEQENGDEHRLMRAQIDDLDSRLPPRRGRRRPS